MSWLRGGSHRYVGAVVGFPTTWLEIHPFRLQKSIKYALIYSKYEISILETPSISGHYGWEWSDKKKTDRIPSQKKSAAYYQKWQFDVVVGRHQVSQLEQNLSSSSSSLSLLFDHHRVWSSSCDYHLAISITIVVAQKKRSSSQLYLCKNW